MRMLNESGTVTVSDFFAKKQKKKNVVLILFTVRYILWKTFRLSHECHYISFAHLLKCKIENKFYCLQMYLNYINCLTVTSEMYLHLIINMTGLCTDIFPQGAHVLKN